jgi:CBS domain-containing protein
MVSGIRTGGVDPRRDRIHSLVKDLMTTPVVTVGPATPFKEIVARLAEHRVSAVPVVDDDG